MLKRVILVVVLSAGGLALVPGLVPALWELVMAPAPVAARSVTEPAPDHAPAGASDVDDGKAGPVRRAPEALSEDGTVPPPGAAPSSALVTKEPAADSTRAAVESDREPAPLVAVVPPAPRGTHVAPPPARPASALDRLAGLQALAESSGLDCQALHSLAGAADRVGLTGRGPSEAALELLAELERDAAWRIERVALTPAAGDGNSPGDVGLSLELSAGNGTPGGAPDLLDRHGAAPRPHALPAIFAQAPEPDPASAPASAVAASAAQAPPPSADAADASATAPPPAGHHVTLVLLAGSTARAVVDGVLLEVGDRLGEARVTTIDADGLVLRDAHGLVAYALGQPEGRRLPSAGPAAGEDPP